MAHHRRHAVDAHVGRTGPITGRGVAPGGGSGAGLGLFRLFLAGSAFASLLSVLDPLAAPDGKVSAKLAQGGFRLRAA